MCVEVRGVFVCMNIYTPSRELFPINVKDDGLGINSQIQPRKSTFVDLLVVVSLTFKLKVHGDAVILFAVFTLFRLTRSWKIIISVVFILTFFLVGKSYQIMILKAGFGSPPPLAFQMCHLIPFWPSWFPMRKMMTPGEGEAAFLLFLSRFSVSGF